ncbi:hypothetical protein [Bradyrhizobium sp. 1(2017)]|uniref:hypothetical protein n=1 Tax=Bradyrhizobium sp. 1(2017) TaxID=1404888 RepID=UPI00140F1BED|nr:hypothetical protein [Bradyrhizobium sp. 1(2017)]QIO32358.1 hypothetical protein HAP40_11230 [Bradyrhizobium sp. 1(2017)]
MALIPEYAVTDPDENHDSRRLRVDEAGHEVRRVYRGQEAAKGEESCQKVQGSSGREEDKGQEEKGEEALSFS